MSLNIDNIYCSHFVKHPKLIDMCKNHTFESFDCPGHEKLTCFHIKDSIHYNSLVNNNYKNYEEYVSISGQKEHNLNIFLDLMNNFDISKMKKINILYCFKKNKYLIQDGVHRLSILLYKKIINDTVPLKFLDIQQNNCFYFVIYEHGINYKEEIYNEIEKSGIRIDKKINLNLPTDKFPEFVCDIYPDTNKKFILDKNNYILSINEKKESINAAIILVSIDKVQNMGKKVFQIETIKRKIRNLYNPKLENPNKHIKPLDKGVSHNHIIHSTDVPKEFIEIYNILEKYYLYILK